MEEAKGYIATVCLEAYTCIQVSSSCVEDVQKEIEAKGLPAGNDWIVNKYVTQVEEIHVVGAAGRALQALIEEIESQSPQMRTSEVDALAAELIKSLQYRHPVSKLLGEIFQEGSPN